MDAEIVCGTALPLDVSEMEYAAAGLYAPGEVMGLDHGGRVVAWGGAARGPYRNGQALPDIDPDGMGVVERERVERDASRLGRPLALPPAPGAGGRWG